LPPNFKILELHPGLEARLLLFLGLSIHKGNDSFFERSMGKMEKAGASLERGQSRRNWVGDESARSKHRGARSPRVDGKNHKKNDWDLNEGRGE